MIIGPRQHLDLTIERSVESIMGFSSRKAISEKKRCHAPTATFCLVTFGTSLTVLPKNLFKTFQSFNGSAGSPWPARSSARPFDKTAMWMSS
jgi:hypothetical protein